MILIIKKVSNTVVFPVLNALGGALSGVEAAISPTAFLLSPYVPAAPRRFAPLLAFTPFHLHFLRGGSAGPDSATRTGSSIVEEARLGGLPLSSLTTFLVARIIHRSHPPA